MVGWNCMVRGGCDEPGVGTHIATIFSRISLISLLTRRPPNSRRSLGRAAGLSRALPAQYRLPTSLYCITLPVPLTFLSPRLPKASPPFTLFPPPGFPHLYGQFLSLTCNPFITPTPSQPATNTHPKTSLPCFAGQSWVSLVVERKVTQADDPGPS